MIVVDASGIRVGDMVEGHNVSNNGPVAAGNTGSTAPAIQGLGKRIAFVKAVRGPNGGYKLALKAEDIIMSDVIEVIEGKIETKGCSQKHISCTGISGKCLNHDLWDELGKQINLFLSHISLKDILEGNILGRSRAPILAQDCDNMTIN